MFGGEDPVELAMRFVRAGSDSGDIALFTGRWNQKTWIELPTRPSRDVEDYVDTGKKAGSVVIDVVDWSSDSERSAEAP